MFHVPDGVTLDQFELLWRQRVVGKPAALKGASVDTIGTARAQYHLRQTFVFLDMDPINRPEAMIGNAATRFDSDGTLTDETTKGFIRDLLRNLVEWTRRLAQPPGKG